VKSFERQFIMDQIKTGNFIAALRREKGLTQEALGAKLGVTNKTVSRWENGNYMPDVETLRLLSKEFGVSMEELIDGGRLGPEAAAETPKEDKFTQAERIAFWKRNWKRENRSTVIFWYIIVVVGIAAGAVFEKPTLLAVFTLSTLALRIYFYNRMMGYVERNAYKIKE